MGEPRLIELADFDRVDGGSFSVLLSGIARAAIERGWQVEIAMFESAADAPWVGELREQGVPVHLAPVALRGSDRSLARWVSALAETTPGPTVLHSHFTGFDIAVSLAARGRGDVKKAWHLHGPLPKDPYHFARALIKQGVLGRAIDAILCPAPNIVADALARGAPRGRVHFFPSAIDPEDFPIASPAERESAREQLGIADDVTVLLHFGWHWGLKGGALFVDTVAELTRARPEAEVLALERGGDERYIERARRLGLGERFRLVEPVPDVGVLHAAADVQVASSKIEGMAFGVLESLCTGTPVVATDIPGHAFLAERIEACQLAPHDPRRLAATTIETLDRDPEQAARESREGRRWIAENLAVEILAPQLVDFFDDLINERAPMLRW